ncbi:MAG TPA: hypothetical protein PKE31_21395 [Pseudomonadota bacterium]|jgi:hypothetical protein|nr:hypothetical protein [Pseudomonadota bacterium]
MDRGVDISIFANGLPDVASRQISSRPALDLTLSPITDRDVLIMDAYKLQFTPPELLFWSRDANNQPVPLTINLPDLLQDSIDNATLASLTSTIEAVILADARFADIRVEIEQSGSSVTISETILPTDESEPIELVINATGSAVTLVKAA